MQLKIDNKFLIWNEVDSRYFIITGGRGSGKSFAINTMLLLLTQEAGHTILFTRYTLRSANISIIPEFKEKIDLLNLNHLFHITKDEIINKGSGSKILFRGIKTSSGDQTANLKSLQGITTWVMDEAEELTDETIFDKIDLSVRQKAVDNRIILILNPTTKEKLGGFKEVGAIVLGQDFGFSSDASTLLKTSIDKKNKIIYIQECFYKTRLTTSQIAELNKRFAKDNLIVADSAEPRLINELSRECNIVPAIKGQGSITFGISLLQDYDLIIDPESINLVKELNNYSWLEKKSRTPIDKFNHLIDALRYAVSYQLENPNKGEYHIY